MFQLHLMHTFGKSSCTDLTLPHRETVGIILKVIVITVNLLETYSKGSCAIAAHKWTHLFIRDGKAFFCIAIEQFCSTFHQLILGAIKYSFFRRWIFLGFLKKKKLQRQKKICNIRVRVLGEKHNLHFSLTLLEVRSAELNCWNLYWMHCHTFTKFTCIRQAGGWCLADFRSPAVPALAMSRGCN